MSAEVRVLAEGTFRIVQQSGSGLTWATASAPASGLMGFVQNGMSITSAQKIETIMERGKPAMQKVIESSPIKVAMKNLISYQTGKSLPFTMLTASGSTVPMFLGEWKQAAPEIGATSALYYQFYGCAIESLKLTEDAKGDNNDWQFVALAMNGPTASGYLG